MLCPMVIIIDIFSHRVVHSHLTANITLGSLVKESLIRWTEDKCICNNGKGPRLATPKCSEKSLEPNLSSENE